MCLRNGCVKVSGYRKPNSYCCYYGHMDTTDATHDRKYRCMHSVLLQCYYYQGKVKF